MVLSEGNIRPAASPAHALPDVAGNALCPRPMGVLPFPIAGGIAKTLLRLQAVEMEKQKVKGDVLVAVLGVVFATPLIQKALEAEEGGKVSVLVFVQDPLLDYQIDEHGKIFAGGLQVLIPLKPQGADALCCVYIAGKAQRRGLCNRPEQFGQLMCLN